MFKFNNIIKFNNMIKLNNTILLPSFNEACKLLSNKSDTHIDTNYICGEKIALMHYNIKNINVVRIWKTNSVLNYWYTDFTNSNRNDFIAAFDYIINDDFIKIDYIYINDKSSQICNNYSDYLSDEEVIQIKKAIFIYIENLAKVNNVFSNTANKKKIIVDVHNNLKLFNEYYKPEGFQLTDRRSLDNKNWIISEKVLD